MTTRTCMRRLKTRHGEELSAKERILKIKWNLSDLHFEPDKLKSHSPVSFIVSILVVLYLYKLWFRRLVENSLKYKSIQIYNNHFRHLKIRASMLERVYGHLYYQLFQRWLIMLLEASSLQEIIIQQTNFLSAAKTSLGQIKTLLNSRAFNVKWNLIDWKW